MKRPSFQFYPGDWLNDASLRACSIGARGLWVDMLCLMHQGSEYGCLKVNHRPILPENLARMLGATTDDVIGWLDELEQFGVFSRDESGCILSRRMIRDEKIRQARAAGGSLGGNPALKGKKKDEEKDEEKVNLDDNLRPTPSSSSSSSSSVVEPIGSVDKVDRLPACDYDAVVALYHEILPELPSVRVMSDGRRKVIQTRWRWILTSKKIDGSRRAETAEQAVEWLRQFFTLARDNDFVMGRGWRDPKHANWQADIEYLLSERGLKQVVEKTRGVE